MSTKATFSRSDPVMLLPRLIRKLANLWLKTTYPFAHFGSGVSIALPFDISRSTSTYVWIGDRVSMARDVWLNVQLDKQVSEHLRIRLGSRSNIGRRSTISAQNYIEIGEDVLTGPSVLIMDHNHEYSDPEQPIQQQGTTQGGRIVIGRNCWLGYGAVVCCGAGELTIGRNSVVAANAVITKSYPPFSVIAGNPAKLIRRYDPESRQWKRVSQESHEMVSEDQQYR